MGEHIVEHEPEITTTHGTFKQSQLKDVIIKKPDLQKVQPKYCPLMKRGCIDRCAYHGDDGCIIVTGGDLQKGVCPYSQLYTCSDDCTAYAGANCLLMARPQHTTKPRKGAKK